MNTEFKPNRAVSQVVFKGTGTSVATIENVMQRYPLPPKKGAKKEEKKKDAAPPEPKVIEPESVS
jgi:hypothetical protein